MTIDVTGVIESWTIITEEEGNLKLDIQKCSYDSFPNFTSICGTELPQLGVLNNSQERKAKNDTLSSWSTEVYSGDIFQFEVIYSINISRLFMQI